jgi:type II secretory pathway component PulK
MRLRVLSKSRRRAVVLVLTLWIVMVLSLLAESLAFEMFVEMKLTGLHRDQFLAEQLGRIGVSRAVADLRNDNLLAEDQNIMPQTHFDAYSDVWAGGSTKPRVIEVASEERGDPVGNYSLLVVDEESKLDLNNSNPLSREVMKDLLILLDVKETEASDISDAIYDWKDLDNMVCSGKGESEISYYSKMEGKTRGSDEGGAVCYPKNAPFDTVEELLQIPGMTAELFYGYDPSKGGKPEFFPSQGEERGRRKPGLKDLVSVRARQSNINTLREECLAAVLGFAAGSVQTGESLARAVVQYRQSEGETGIDNTSAFRSVDQLGQLEGISSPLLAKARSVVPLTTQSNSFTIFCEARYGKRAVKVWNSRSRTSDDRPLPTARIVVTCDRAYIPYLEEEGQEEAIPPGCKSRAMVRPDGVSVMTWLVPVVYLKGWNSF